MWDRSDRNEDLDRDHPYLVRMGIKGNLGLMGRLDDELLIPMFHNGDIVNLLRIGTDGVRRFLPGGRVIGCFTYLGNSRRTWKKDDGAIIVLCAHWPDAWSIWTATGYDVAIAFNTHNMRITARLVRQQYPDARIIVAAENNRWHSTAEGERGNFGVATASSIAAECCGQVAIPDFASLDGRPETFDDLRRREGVEAVIKWMNPKHADFARTIPNDEPDPEDPPDPPKLDEDEDTLFHAIEMVLGTQSWRQLSDPKFNNSLVHNYESVHITCHEILSEAKSVRQFIRAMDLICDEASQAAMVARLAVVEQVRCVLGGINVDGAVSLSRKEINQLQRSSIPPTSC